MPAAVDRSTSPLRWLERLYRAAPVRLPPAVTNAYLRRTVADDFDGYDHPPDPLAPLAVDPGAIERFTGRPFPPYHDHAAQLGSVSDGDWDRRADAPVADEAYRDRYDLYRADRFSESVFFESMAAHFEDGVDWTETPFVERCLELAENDDPSWRSMTSQDAILERCARVDDLYESVRRDGYRSQRDLGETSVLRVADEVLVDVGRDGELLFVNGRHRLAIAKLLDVESIPAGVLVRHADWMAYRDECARTGTVPAHPDLRDLRDRNAGGPTDAGRNLLESEREPVTR